MIVLLYLLMKTNSKKPILGNRLTTNLQKYNLTSNQKQILKIIMNRIMSKTTITNKQTGTHTIMRKFKDQMSNLDKIWTDKLRNGITMPDKKIIEDGDIDIK